MSRLSRNVATRYVEPLREGGSVPAIVETDTGRLVVGKWRGAGQGALALVAEVIAGELARAMGLPVPRLCELLLGTELAKTERDPEIRDILMASVGLNLGMDYLSGAFAFDPAAALEIDPHLCARIVVFDAFVMNVDRTARNTNLMWQEGELWLIDHGAAMYWHHGWDGTVERPDRGFPLIREHTLLSRATDLRAEGRAMLSGLTDADIVAAVEAVPEAWLPEPAGPRRNAYVDMLRRRRDGASSFIEEAAVAREAL